MGDQAHRRVYVGTISAVLGALYSLPDDQAEFQILDRRSFGRLLGFDDRNKVPDAKTIWLALPRAAAARCRGCRVV